jgi:hypothetical protein
MLTNALEGNNIQLRSPRAGLDGIEDRHLEDGAEEWLESAAEFTLQQLDTADVAFLFSPADGNDSDAIEAEYDEDRIIPSFSGGFQSMVRIIRYLPLLSCVYAPC